MLAPGGGQTVYDVPLSLGLNSVGEVSTGQDSTAEERMPPIDDFFSGPGLSLFGVDMENDVVVVGHDGVGADVQSKV